MKARPSPCGGPGHRAGSIRIETEAIDSLGEALLARWQRIQDEVPAFASPFLGPGWAKLVSACGRNVRVAVLFRDRTAVGFFPFELVEAGHGKPVGTVFSDYQAAVVEPGVELDAERLLDAAGLRRWDFDHLLKAQAPFERYHRQDGFSPVLDLSCGFEHYRRRLAAQGRRQLQQAARRRRQMERALGPVTFRAHEPDLAILGRLLELKAAQWTRSGWSGRFEAPWERALTAGLVLTNTPAFGGMLSVLRAAGKPVAIHLGLRSRTIWHYWITAYDPEAAHFSPGIVMLDRMCRSAPALGLSTIDLGKGEEGYKRRFMTGAVAVAEGTALRPCAEPQSQSEPENQAKAGPYLPVQDQGRAGGA